MPYRKIGKGKYIEVEKRPMNYDMNLPEGQRVLYRTHINTAEYVLYGNGVIKCTGITHCLSRVCMKPNEGRIYTQVDGVNEMMRRMLGSNKISADEKFDYSNRVGAEYFTPQVIAEIQCNLDNLTSKKCSYDKTDWNGLVQRKQDEQSVMEFKAQQEEKETYRLIEKLKNNNKIVCVEC